MNNHIHRFKKFVKDVAENYVETIACCKKLQSPLHTPHILSQSLDFFDYQNREERLFYVAPCVSVTKENWEEVCKRGINRLLSQGIIRLQQLYRDFVGDSADATWKITLKRVADKHTECKSAIYFDDFLYPDDLKELRNNGAHETVDLEIDEEAFCQHHKRIIEATLVQCQGAAKLLKSNFELDYNTGNSPSPENWNKFTEWFNKHLSN